MGQRGLDGRREDPELRDVNHDEKNEPRLGDGRPTLTGVTAIWS